MVSLGSLKISSLFFATVLIFFTAGLLSIAPRARQSLGAYRIPPETGLLIPSEKRDYRNVWSAAELQAKNEEWQVVCANVFGLQWSQRLRAMMDVRSLSSS